MATIQIFAWFAIFLLASSYWLQVYKIFKHREVRDLSVWTYIFLLFGYFILSLKATNDYLVGDNEWFWIVRQLVTMVPVTIVLWQIWMHKKERWHDEGDPFCKGCQSELELNWRHCPFCPCREIYFKKGVRQ